MWQILNSFVNVSGIQENYDIQFTINNLYDENGNIIQSTVENGLIKNGTIWLQVFKSYTRENNLEIWNNYLLDYLSPSSKFVIDINRYIDLYNFIKNNWIWFFDFVQDGGVFSSENNLVASSYSQFKETFSPINNFEN